MTSRGLNTSNDPFARRAKAADAFLPKPPKDEKTKIDQEKPDTNETTSNVASNNASNETVEDTKLSREPAPPPSKEPAGRVQFNQRILADQRKILDRYRRQHGASWQGLFDQMVEEYLHRRNLLP